VRENRPERLRVFTADCPLDAGSRTVFWFAAATPAESLALLDSLTRPAVVDVNARTVAESAVTAIGLHGAAGVDTILDRLSAPDEDDHLRQRAFLSLATARGAHGFNRLSALLAGATDVASRRALTRAIGQTMQPGTADVLLRIAREDPTGDVRGEAAYYYVQHAASGSLDAARALIDSDPSDVVRRRAVGGLARLPDRIRVPALVELARTSRHADVRKEAVRALGESGDPRATTFLEQIVAQAR
jgi:HEAT repeat protein